MKTISKEWEKGSEETRKSLAEGNGITFPNAKEANKWLKQAIRLEDDVFDRFINTEVRKPNKALLEAKSYTEKKLEVTG